MGHEKLRQTKKWGTYGKDGKGPLKQIIIKDISDDHLDQIISFIEKRINHYGMRILQLMIDEMCYRKDENISIPPYESDIKPRTLLRKKKIF